MRRLRHTNQLLYRAGHVLWVNAATVWLVIASTLLVMGFLVVRNQQHHTHALTVRTHRLAVQTHKLELANRARIADIQRSRIESCKRTYRSFHQVFDPFFPKGAKRTAKVRTQLRKFNTIVARQIRQCTKQVRP